MIFRIKRVLAILLTTVLTGSGVEAATVETIFVSSQTMGKEIPVTILLPDPYKTSAQEFYRSASASYNV